MSAVVGAAAARLPLWSRSDGLRLALLVGAGAVVLVASWFFAAGRADAGDQLVFVSLSLFGLLLGTAGVYGWVMRGRRAIVARTGLLLGAAPAATLDDVPSAGDLVAGPEAKWFHRADCLLVEGRNFAVSPRATHETAGRRACPGCKP
jgi:hypothetical protein